MKGSMLPPWPVAEAICEQLSWVADFTWPPKLRAVHAIDYISGKGEEARELLDLISERAGPLLLQLTHIPQLKAKTVEVMRNLRVNAAFNSFSTNSAFGSFSAVKSDEESCMLRMRARADTQDGNVRNSKMGLSQWSTLADLLGLPLPKDWLSRLRILDGALCFEPCQQEPNLVKTLRIAAPPPIDANEDCFAL